MSRLPPATAPGTSGTISLSLEGSKKTRELYQEWKHISINWQERLGEAEPVEKENSRGI